MPVVDADALVLIRRGDRAEVVAPGYRLVIEHTGEGFRRSPYAVLHGTDERVWARLNLLASVHSASAPDETLEIEPPEFEEQSEVVVIRVRTTSTAWAQREVALRCTGRGVEVSVAVEGSGAITDVTLLGGDAVLARGATGPFRSAIGFASVFAPVASEPVQLVRPARAPVALTVSGDADPGRLNAVFAPPPLALGLARELASGATDVPEGEWLGLWLREAVERCTFTAMRYAPLDGGFRIELTYDGHTVVAGTWRSPTIVLAPSTGGWAVLDDYRADLVAHGFASAAPGRIQDWWLEPIFCGWGAQCARAALEAHGGVAAPETADEENAVVRSAPALARQDVYDSFLATLDAAGLEPGTIVIDDRWQAAYGAATVDEDAWPDLRGWIADRHREGRTVLLWWKAWDPEGIPIEECIVDAAGRPIAVDPGNPAYLHRLDGIIRRLLGADGLDADGFKVDFTQRTPAGRSLTDSGTWGIAALHTLLDAIHASAKAVKPDSLVICHAVHPSFGAVQDMVRLNDVSKEDIHGVPVPVAEQARMRREIVRRVLPHHPVDTDQWPMPDRDEWLAYAREQWRLGVPALYYVDAIDGSGEPIGAEHLAVVAETWREYRAAR